MVRTILFFLPLILACVSGPSYAVAAVPQLPARVQEILNNSTRKAMTFVGSLGSKFYFTEATHMSWFEADTYCKTETMHLVSVRNPAELTYLRELNAALPVRLRWWTSGRNVNKFEWSDGAAIDYNIGTPHQGCVLLYGRDLYEDHCDGSQNGNVYHPLCELINDGDA